ncbi:MAG: TetR/AcrR family transcriptional regulator; helix-turn-helix transcriptional regulator [Chloroflexi bacterium]|nr:TetR/AcrR family transcriptional regulator; helix-turn-helix transcriptional regulator [Chloroflexota bacterium]
MTRIATGTMGAYNELRAAQAQATRARILDATLRVMARGIASVSIPAVASEAGVSVPTVYRHFGTKRDLLAAIFPHVVGRAALDELVPPRSIDELRQGVRALFERLDAAGDLARAASVSPAADEVRRVDMPARKDFSRRLADSVVPKLAPTDRDRIARLLTILISASTLRVWRDHLGSSVEEAADDIDWVIRAAIAASTRSER